MDAGRLLDDHLEAPGLLLMNFWFLVICMMVAVTRGHDFWRPDKHPEDQADPWDNKQTINSRNLSLCTRNDFFDAFNYETF